jgi:cytochrome c oxidase subunit IV
MENEQSHVEHAPNYGVYILVWLALLTLTVTTAVVAGINFGALSVAIALIIAASKSYLVLSIFMHLRIENKVFRVFLFVALLFFAISIVLIFSDYSNYVR